MRQIGPGHIQFAGCTDFHWVLNRVQNVNVRVEDRFADRHIGVLLQLVLALAHEVGDVAHDFGGSIEIAQHGIIFTEIIEEFDGQRCRQYFARANPKFQATQQIRIAFQPQVDQQRFQQCRHQHQTFDFVFLQCCHQQRWILRHMLRHNQHGILWGFRGSEP